MYLRHKSWQKGNFLLCCFSDLESLRHIHTTMITRNAIKCVWICVRMSRQKGKFIFRCFSDLSCLSHIHKTMILVSTIPCASICIASRIWSWFWHRGFCIYAQILPFPSSILPQHTWKRMNFLNSLWAVREYFTEPETKDIDMLKKSKDRFSHCKVQRGSMQPTVSARLSFTLFGAVLPI